MKRPSGFEILVTDVNDVAPVITSDGGGDTAYLTVAENGTAVTTVAASDADGPALDYAITGGNDAGLFAIDAATGVLTFVSAPDFEAPADFNGDNVYKLVVSASDGTFSTSQEIGIQVTGVNEGPRITSLGGGDSAVASVDENSLFVANVAASDPEGQTLAYAIVGGADAARFQIDAATGALRFVSAPNFEAPGDVGADNVYDVVVAASDGALGDAQAIAVSVANRVDGVTRIGNSGSNTLTGTEAEDTLLGLGGNDTLLGGGGGDALEGGSGGDRLTGGRGADSLSGGAGADRFIFESTADSRPDAVDVITDFSRAQNDRIELDDIDANSLFGGNQSFSFIGTAAFSGSAGQLRYTQAGGNTLVTGDVNGDAVADFAIQVTGTPFLSSSDFIL